MTFKIFRFVLLVFTSMQCSLCLSQTVTVQVGDFSEKVGTINICLYVESDTFMEEGKEFKCQTKVVSEGVETFTFQTKEFKYGAFTTFHDKNGNKELDTNFFGIPTEPYGFSNNPVIRFGPPSFEESKVDLTNSEKIVIELK